MRYSNFTKNDEIEFLELTKSGLLATFIYSKNVVANGCVKRYSDADSSIRTIAISDVIFVPVSLFTDFLGAKLQKHGDTFTLSSNEFELSVVPGDASYYLDGKKALFEKAPILKSEVLYLPAVSASRALGYSANVYYDGRLFAVGNKEVIERLESSPSLANAGGYVVFGEYDASVFTPADYKAARIRWRERLVGSEKINDLENPTVIAKINKVNENCKTWWDSMNRGSDSVILWGESKPVESEELNTQYKKIACMARGYATYGSKYYKNKDLLRDIIFAMDWMYENMYGEAEINGTGWRDVRLFNWWFWYVGAPEYITDILFMLEDEVSLEDKKRYLKCFEWIATIMCTNENAALSRISICTKVGIALEEPKYIQTEYKDFDYLLELKETQGGARVDYSDFTHNFPYNMAYGMLHLDRVLYVSSILSGTALEFANPQQYNQFGMARYMFEPAMYCGQGMIMFNGRSTFRAEVESGIAAIVNLLPMLGVFGEDEDRHLRGMIKRNSGSERVRNAVKSMASLYTLSLYEDILKDESLSFENNYEYAHSWYTADRAAQHRNGYAVGIAMSSKREFTYESINSANKTGWYTGDGALYLYTKYDDSQYDGENFLLKNINVAYRFPGTTEDSRERVIRSIRSGRAWMPSKSFAGSIQIDDKYIVAAMDYESMHFEGPDDLPCDDGYGGGLAIHYNDLVSKKAWFCFDDEIISLSAGINSTMDSEVRTTVEHRRIVNDERYFQLVGVKGEAFALEKAPFEKTYEEAEWLLMEGHAGFVFLENAKLYVGRYNWAESNNQPFFEARIEHGKNPVNQSYAYAVIPYADKDKLNAYSKNPDVEIISNTPELQAVREKNIGISGYVFHRAGSCDGITVDAPAIIVKSEKNDFIEITLNDSTHELSEITVTIDKELAVVEKNTKMAVYYSDGKTVIKANVASAHGRAFTVKLK